MTVEIRAAASELAEILKEKFSPKIPISHDVVVDTVTRDSHGQVTAATATIEGIEGLPIQVPYGLNIAPGMRLSAANYGSLTSPNWVVTGVLGKIGPPRVYEFTQEIPLSGTTFSPGDALFGDPSGANMFFDVSEAQLRLRLGTQDMIILDADDGYISLDGMLRVLHPLGPSIEISTDGLVMRDAANFPFFNAGTYVDSTTGEPRSYLHIGTWDSGIHMDWNADTEAYDISIPAKLITGHLESITINAEQITAGFLSVDRLQVGSIPGDRINPTSSLVVGTGDQAVFIDGSHAEYRIWTGNTNPASANFAVTRYGRLEAMDARIRGYIEAESGVLYDLSVQGVVRVGLAGFDQVVIDGHEVTIHNDRYVPDQSGWILESDGSAEFQNVKIRGSFFTSVFRYQEIHASNGHLLVSNAATLTSDVSSAASAIEVQDPVFDVGEIIRLRTRNQQEYMQVTSSASPVAGGYRYGVTRDLVTSGSNPLNWQAGDAVVSEGQSGEGFLFLSADGPDTPYLDVVLRNSATWNDTSTKVRLGKLDSISDASLNPTGFGLYADNVFLKGVIIATGGELQSLSITDAINVSSNGHIAGGNIGIGASDQPIGGSGFWLGRNPITGNYDFVVGSQPTQKYLHWNGVDLTVRGTVYADDGALGNLSVEDMIEVTSPDGAIILGTTKDEINAGTAKAHMRILNDRVVGYGEDGNEELVWFVSGQYAGSIRTPNGEFTLDRYGPRMRNAAIYLRFQDQEESKFVADLSGWANGARVVGSHTWAPRWLVLTSPGRLEIADHASGVLNFSADDWLGFQTIVYAHPDATTPDFMLLGHGHLVTTTYQGGPSSGQVHTSPTVNYFIYINSAGKFNFRYSNKDTGGWVCWQSTNAIISAGQWRSISFRFKYGDPSSATLYVGSMVSAPTQRSGSWVEGTGSETPASGSGDKVYIGTDMAVDMVLQSWNSYDGSYHKSDEYTDSYIKGNGYLYDLRLWRRQLTDDELASYRFTG